MTRKQDLIAAFTTAIRELGVDELKKSSLFARGQERTEADIELKMAA